MHSNTRKEGRGGKKREEKKERRAYDLTYCTDLEVAGGAWGCSSTNAQAAAAAGLGPGRFGYVRERVDAWPRVVFFGPLFGHKPQHLAPISSAQITLRLRALI